MPDNKCHCCGKYHMSIYLHEVFLKIIYDPKKNSDEIYIENPVTGEVFKRMSIKEMVPWLDENGKRKR